MVSVASLLDCNIQGLGLIPAPTLIHSYLPRWLIPLNPTKVHKIGHKTKTFVKQFLLDINKFDLPTCVIHVQSVHR